MKRLFALAGLVAALTVSSFVFASVDLVPVDLVPVDDPIAMSQTSDFVTDLIVQDSFDATFEVLNVSFTTSSKFFPAKCGELAGDTPQKRPGGFCAAVDSLKSMGTEKGSPPDPCDAILPPPTCEVDV